VIEAWRDDIFENRRTAVTPKMKDHHGREHVPSQVQRTAAATASSTVVQLSARGMAMATGRGALTGGALTLSSG
jgi:hypothetical protein